MLVRSIAALLVLSALTVGSAHAAGEVIILLRSSAASEAGQEAFNRLRGELTLHGFRVEIVEVEGMATVADLESTADKAEAVASVAFIPSAGTQELSRVDIWIGDRVTGTTVKRTIRPGSGKDGPSVLAVRALELLRSTLRSYDANAEQGEVEGAHPERAQNAVKELAAPPAKSSYFYLAGGGVFAYSFPDGGASGGPELSLGYQHESWGLSLLAHGPLLGSTTRIDFVSPTESGSAQFRALSMYLLAEPSWSPLLSETWELSFFPSVGGSYLAISGQADPPFQGENDSAWLFAAGGGMQFRARLATRLQLYWSARGLMMLPSPTVVLATVETELNRPQVSTSLGLRIAL